MGRWKPTTTLPPEPIESGEALDYVLTFQIWLCPYGVRLHGLHCLAEPSSYETVEGIYTWQA